MSTTYLDRFSGSVYAAFGKQPCDAASASNISLNGYQTVDGINLNADYLRCLVMGQSNATLNGIYEVFSGAWVRATDFSGPSGTVDGQMVYVTGGTANGGLWRVNTANPIQIDQSGGQSTSPSSITFQFIAPISSIAQGLLGNAVSGTQNVPQVVPVGAGLGFSGGSLVIPAGGVTNAMHAAMPANSVKVNATGGSATPTDLSLANNVLLGTPGGTLSGVPLGAGLDFNGGTGALEIMTAGVSNSMLALSGATSGSYTNANLTINGQGVVTAASSGSGTSLTALTNSLSSDVALNNTSNYFDGPSVSTGSSGTWFVSGTVTMYDTAAGSSFSAKLWDGTTVISSTEGSSVGASANFSLSLSGRLATPAGNIKISVKDINGTTGHLAYNSSGNSKDCTITAIRIV